MRKQPQGIKKPPDLTPRQKFFCKEYLKDFSGTRSAIAAGYSKKSAHAQASRLLRHAKVSAFLAQVINARSSRIGADADKILSELLLLAKSDIADAYDENGNLLPANEIPENLRRAVSGVEVMEEFSGRGEDRVSIGFTKKLKLWDKPRALELLGKHLGLFLEKVDHTGAITITIKKEIVSVPGGS